MPAADSDEHLSLVEAIAVARRAARHLDPADEDPGVVFVCRGPALCGGSDCLGCPWCVAVQAGDPRTDEQIAQAVSRGH